MMIERVGVVGAGLMGSGIAEICGRAGSNVIVIEKDRESLEKGITRIKQSLENGVKRQKVTADEAGEVERKIEFTTNWDDLRTCQIAIEAIYEDEASKIEIFQNLDRTMEDSEAILASNTSSIPIMKLAMETKRPTKVCGLHFFNPVPILDLVELVPSLVTEDEIIERARTFASGQLKKIVILSKDRAGFVVNALLIPFILSAIRMVESGFATAEDIDLGMVKGCNHPMGPLALADLIGLDTTIAVAESLYEEFKEPLYASPPLLSRMVDAGLLGKKVGRGFYKYSVSA